MLPGSGQATLPGRGPGAFWCRCSYHAGIGAWWFLAAARQGQAAGYTRLKLPILGAAVLGGTALRAQCATLDSTGNGAAGTNLTLAITGADVDQFAFLLLGTSAGSSSLQLGPFGTLNFGLAQPWFPYYIGQTNPAGAAAVTIPIPLSLPVSTTMAGQGLTFGLESGTSTPTLNSCTTNVITFRIG